MTDSPREHDLRTETGVCQHDLLKPDCTVTVHDNDPYTGSCWVCRQTWSTRHIILDQVVEDRFTGQQPAKPGSGEVKRFGAWIALEPRSEGNMAGPVEAVLATDFLKVWNDLQATKIALAAAKAYADDMEARYHTAHERLTAAQQRITDLERDLENERARGIHTCHDQCQRPLCVAQRRIAELRGCLAELTALVNGESPALLNEDSGGDGELAVRIDNALEDPT